MENPKIQQKKKNNSTWTDFGPIFPKIKSAAKLDTIDVSSFLNSIFDRVIDFKLFWVPVVELIVEAVTSGSELSFSLRKLWSEDNDRSSVIGSYNADFIREFSSGFNELTGLIFKEFCGWVRSARIEANENELYDSESDGGDDPKTTKDSISSSGKKKKQLK